MNIVTGFLTETTTPSDPAFQKWFADSKAVDAAGNPLVVYHGTNQTFDTFSKRRGGMATGPRAGATRGFFFTSDYDEAVEYAQNAGRKVVANIAQFEKDRDRLRKDVERLERIAQRTGRSEDWNAYEQAMLAWENFEIDATREEETVNTHVISAYLSLQNPLEADFKGTIMSEHGVIEDVVERAVREKRDGVIMRNIYDSPLGVLAIRGQPSDHYVVFSAKQIRRI